MNRLYLRGLPIVESALYRKRLSSERLGLGKKFSIRRASTICIMNKRNVDYNQSPIIKDARVNKTRQRAPVEIYTSSIVTHQATRKRFLPICESCMDKEDAYPFIFQ